MTRDYAQEEELEELMADENRARVGTVLCTTAEIAKKDAEIIALQAIVKNYRDELRDIRKYAWQNGDSATCGMLDEKYGLNPRDELHRMAAERRAK